MAVDLPSGGERLAAVDLPVDPWAVNWASIQEVGATGAANGIPHQAVAVA